MFSYGYSRQRVSRKHLLICYISFALIVQCCFSLTVFPSSLRLRTVSRPAPDIACSSHRGRNRGCNSRGSSVPLFSILLDIEDEEELESFTSIAQSYLAAKFMDCVGDSCVFSRERGEVESLLREVLPPVTAAELQEEVQQLIQRISNDDELISVDTYTRAVLDNKYWREAGVLVVKELIFLDCLHSFYYRKKNLLNDEDYNELKEQLMWEGSVAASIKGSEAHFLTAVAAAKRGLPVLGDAEYESLKQQLKAEGSWVVNREADPLQKLGMRTFTGYLHRSLA